jgi:hypothetical protein
MPASIPRRFAPLDILVALTVLAAGVAALPTLLEPGAAAKVRICRDNTIVAEYGIGDDVDLVVSGAEGPMRIRVHDRSAWIAHSSCRRQICVQGGRISSPGQQLVCVPNHVVVEVLGGSSEGGPDAVTR